MNLATRRLTQTAAVLLLGMSVSSAWAVNTCPPTGSGSLVVEYPPDPTCPNGVVKMLSVPTAEEPSAPYEAPDPVYFFCEGNGHGYLCEAWPQADSGLTYAWSGGGSIRITYPTTSPYISVSCNGPGTGTLTVRVYNGPAYGTHSTSLFCP